jgi:hypothetical protein
MHSAQSLYRSARIAVTSSSSGGRYVFVEPVGGWGGILTETAKLTASDGSAFDEFGESVAISSDTVVFGAPNYDIGGIADQLGRALRPPRALGCTCCGRQAVEAPRRLPQGSLALGQRLRRSAISSSRWPS